MMRTIRNDAAAWWRDRHEQMMRPFTLKTLCMDEARRL
jgi:hypothetical protein